MFKLIGSQNLCNDTILSYITNVLLLMLVKSYNRVFQTNIAFPAYI